ncbi:MAG: DUF2096 family protein [Candidatus Freyarchaeota archaeon]|nr:DUF2096 family protein [Candidatus Jordarchaeia archaeon]MBS7268893.1 DUF2096 family protein [Candidatus Jordarchaeia archaeon]MBS7279733.1 DUF2096 family protein [Candidatus Jordarchaeia archaeon]
MENLPVFESEWYVLNDMLGDLKSKRIRVPSSVAENLRYTRFIIEHYKETPSIETHIHYDYLNDLEAALNNVKAALFEGARELGEDYVALWRKKIDEAPLNYPPPRKKTLVRGLPRDRKSDFVRITFNRDVPKTELLRIAEEHNVNIYFQDDKVVVVSGVPEKIKKAIRIMAERYFQPL